MRGAVAAQKLGFSLSYDHREISPSRAVWAEAQDLGDETVDEALEKTGVPANELVAAAERQDVKEQLRHNTDDAVRRGVFGAPTFFVGGEMFWATASDLRRGRAASPSLNRGR